MTRYKIKQAVMRSLYSKFMFLGIFFICLSLGLQIMWWKKGYIFVKRSVSDGDFLADPDVSLHTPVCNSSAGDCEMRRSSGGLRQVQKLQTQRSNSEPKREVPLSVWDTASGHDRIPEQMRHIPENIKKGDNRTRVIVVDSGPGSWGVKFGSQTFIDHQCPVKNCNLVDRSTSERHIDAVLFGQDIGWFQPYERKITPDTVFIFFALESPLATGNYNAIKKTVNWTATYRRDSTMVAPYERWLQFDNATSIKRVRNYAEGKTKMAAMFVSNCGASNGRLEFAKELQKHVGVDIYGYCGDHQCPRSEAQKCFDILNKDYKFYLAFENANCRDYITEKFFVNGLGHDVIPIVMGAHPEDYEESAPPHSYIHVEDFKTAKDLAEYMKMLDKNDELYNEYFNWKGKGKFLNTKFWCRLCAMVSDSEKPNLVVKNLGQWWKSSDTCTNERWT